MSARLVQLVLLFTTLLAAAFAADTVDRVVVVVNSHPILLSEWDAAVRHQALLEMKPLESIPEEERNRALDRLIDQELIREEMDNSSIQRADAAEIAARVRQIRAQYPGAQDDAAWNGILTRYGVSPSEFDEVVAFQIDEMRVVDARLRSSAQVDTAAIARYYRDSYVPEMRAKGARPASLEEVTPQIRTLLVEQKLNDLIANWLDGLRGSAEIRRIAGPESKP